MSEEPKTPSTAQIHERDYKQAAWQQYTLAELGDWVHLLAKRATHRSNDEKRKKDLYDARNYWAMMGEHLTALEAAARTPGEENDRG